MADIEKILKVIKQLSKDINDVKQDCKEIKKSSTDVHSEINEIKQSTASTKLRMEKIETEISSIGDNINSYKEEAKKNKARIGNIDTQIRKNNLIFYGVDEATGSDTNLETLIISKLKEALNIQLAETDIGRVYRIGKIKDNNSRPIKIEFIAGKKRDELFKAKSLLANNSLSIAEDLPIEIRRERKQFYEIAKKLKEKGKTVYVNNKGLMINGKQATPEELTNLKKESKTA